MKKRFFLDNSPEFSEYSIASEKIPVGFDGFCIAHISDTHSRPVDGIFELVSGARPDIICLTGDMFHDNEDSAPGFWALFEKLLKLAPVYLVTGNHDIWRDDAFLLLKKITDMGGILLDTDCRILEKNGDEISIFGVGDPFSKIPHIIEQNINAEFSKLPSFDGYKILLYHRANVFDKIKDFDFDLILSGHMHGGQIRLPVIGGTLAPTSAMLSGRMIFPKYTGGKYEYNGKTMIVNRGASNTLHIPRFLNAPEVGIIRLSHKNKA